MTFHVCRTGESPDHRVIMLQVQHILCPVDLASSDHVALSQALSLAERCRAQVHVVPFPVSSAANRSTTEGGRSAPVAPAMPRSQGVHAPLLDVVAAATSESPISPDALTVAFDDAAPSMSDLSDYVKTASIDLVVLDTPPGLGAIPALASEPVRPFITELTVPVFITSHRVMPCQSVGARPGTPSRRILVPTDFSENARVALRQAIAMAQEMNAAIDLLHVMDRPQYVALNSTDMLSLSDATLPERKARRRALKEANQASEAAMAGVNGCAPVEITVHIRHGDAANQIGQFAAHEDVDLLVMSTHGTISREHHPLGHVVERVLRRVPRPVFLSRAHGPNLLGANENAGASQKPEANRRSRAASESLSEQIRGDGHTGSTAPPIDQGIDQSTA